MKHTTDATVLNNAKYWVGMSPEVEIDLRVRSSLPLKATTRIIDEIRMMITSDNVRDERSLAEYSLTPTTWFH
tara:strand:+ start:36095 stop:36313 length:219 start_codon:yes stop_codon:yes gene_type:complete